MIQLRSLQVATLLMAVLSPFTTSAQPAGTGHPLISDETVPLQAIAPMAKDRHRGRGYLQAA